MKPNQKNIFEKIYWIMNIVMLFLFGMQFMGGSHKVAFVWLGIVAILGIVWCKRIIIDIAAVFLGIGFFSYAHIIGYDLKTTIIFTGLPVLLYLAGKVWGMQEYSFCSAQTNSKVMILVLTLGTFACGLLEKYSRFFRFTEECYSGRYWFDFWDGGIRPATYFMFYAMMTLGVVFWAIYIRKQYKILSSSFLAFIVIELAFFAWVETRTPFLVVFLVVLAEFAIYLWLNRKEAYIKSTLKIITIAAVILCVMLVAVWYGNLFNIQNSALGKMISHDGGVFGNVRFVAQRNALMQLFQYPMGGKQMDIAGLKYVHNVWLDIAYTAGIIPFLFVSAYTVCTFIECIKLVKSNEVPQEMKYLMTGIFIALHLDYSVEPVLDANLIFWSIGACVSGMIKGYRLCLKRR